MKGLYTSKKDGFISESRHDSGLLRLLAKDNHVDIMLQEIASNTPMWISPDKGQSLLEFFYVIEGEVMVGSGNDKSALGRGEYFYVENISENVPVVSESGATVLYVSSQPVYDELDDYTNTMNELLRASEEKDRYTHNHSKRVTDYSIKISGKLGLTKDIIESLSLSAVFHDIGKYYISDDILNKPSSLSDKEWAQIKQHPSRSRAMLKDKFGNKVADIVYQHHERLDGSGYPKALKADSILLEAKIIAVADSFDAMTSDRAYRKAVDAHTAIAELKSLAGVKYDKDAVDAMEEILKEEGKL